MPKMTVIVSYGEMLDALEEARETLKGTRATAAASCATTDQFVSRYDDLLDILDMGLAQITHAIKDLHDKVVGPANELNVDYLTAVAACSEHCPLSEMAREQLLDQGEQVPPVNDNDPGDWMPDEGEDYEE